MKLLHILFLLTALINFAYAQENLVPNPSFEEYTDCPGGWASFGVQNWFRMNGTPDYYNVCSNNGCLGGGVPCNQTGFQYAKDGNGYVGIITYQVVEPSNINVREFVGVELISPLEQGKKYYVSLYTSLSTLEFTEEAQIACAISNIGVKFTNTIGDNGSGAYVIPVNNIAHIYCDTIISDTLNWTKISSSFIADSAYRYLTIGNHFDNAHTSVACTNTQQYTSAYYYIDALSVSTDSTVGINNTSLDTERIEVYPNPATNIININNTQLSNLFILFDSAGRKITEGELADGINMIDVSKYDRGLYFLQVDNSVTKISFIN